MIRRTFKPTAKRMKSFSRKTYRSWEMNGEILYFDLLKSLLSKDIVEFEFVKKDGSIRHAIGTTNPKIIKMLNCDEFESALQEQKARRVNPNQIKFYDVELDAWRSLSSDMENRGISLINEHADI